MLKLEVGKKYRSRRGDVWDCVEHHALSTLPFMCKSEKRDTWFAANGGYWPCGDRTSDDDLIEEVVDEDATIEPQDDGPKFDGWEDRSAGEPTLPDSGDRTNFSTGAVRDAMQGKGLPSLIPPQAIIRLARRFEDGAAKYSRNNWMKGIPLSRFQDAIQRHLLAAAEGKTDEDHLGAVLWNAAAWIWTQDEIAAGRLPAELDDLPYREQTINFRHDGKKWVVE